ncbi:MAG: alpha/beta hydrolase fold domain-containing protein [Vicinamibacterales bacterium]
MRNRHLVTIVLSLGLSLLPGALHAQVPDSLVSVADITLRYQVVPNITYLTANNFDAKLDVYTVRGATAPVPTLIYIHGGGWTGGSKEGSSLTFLPFLQMGWNVVNVEYRLARVSMAPAAVEDCLCALRWVYRNAKQYNFDLNKLVVTGNSAGGHLALTTGMVPVSAGLDRQCPGTEALRVAAVINWYGITDVVDLLDGPNMKTYAVQWLGSLPGREEIARRASPLTYVRAGGPPVLTIHGDADPVVPYTHATRLKQALDKSAVSNELVTIPNGRHGGFNRQETLMIYGTIRRFLTQHGLTAADTSSR